MLRSYAPERGNNRNLLPSADKTNEKCGTGSLTGVSARSSCDSLAILAVARSGGADTHKLCVVQEGGASMLQLPLSILILVVTSSRVVAGCIEPVVLAHSTVGITRYFDDEEKKTAPPGVLGIRGTGWFLAPLSLVTVKHVVAAMNLSDQNWKKIEIRNEENKEPIAARIQRFAGSHAEKIAVLELQTAFSSAHGFPLRIEPLVAEEPVVSLAYPGDRLRAASGRFVRYGEDDHFAGTALLEMYDGSDRLVLDHGASGAPVLDCTGRVVAAVSKLFTTSTWFMSREIRMSTAWGNPNVVSVPAQVLKEFSRAQ